MVSIAVSDKMRKVQMIQAPFRSIQRGACFIYVVPNLGTLLFQLGIRKHYHCVQSRSRM